MRTCILTLEESDAILAILTELPIRYFPIVQHIQKMLQDKFTQAQAVADTEKSMKD